LLDRVAFGALVKRKRGEKRLTQENLSTDEFGDSARKGDISRIENAKTTPQEATIQKLCSVLGISDAEMAPIRTARPADQLDNIPTLSRAELERLANRFDFGAAYDASDAELREFLTNKATEYRTYRKTIDGLDDRVAAIANLKGAAQDAAERLDFDEVEARLSRVDEVETEIAAETKLARAENALLRGRVDQAATLLTAAADSFASVDRLEVVLRKITYANLLYEHGLRYGGDGLLRAIEMLEPVSGPDIRAANADLWGKVQGTLGNALANLGIRTPGAPGADLLARAVTAYDAALQVWTRAAQPRDWARTQMNLGIALKEQGIRTPGAPGANLLSRAVAAYNAALEVRTREAQPLDWATTQMNLGIALKNQGTRTPGAPGTGLLARAVAAYNAALRVWTSDAQPLDWALVQYNMGITEFHRAQHDSTPDPRPHLEAALTHAENALTQFDPTHTGAYYEGATKLRNRAQSALDDL